MWEVGGEEAGRCSAGTRQRSPPCTGKSAIRDPVMRFRDGRVPLFFAFLFFSFWKGTPQGNTKSILGLPSKTRTHLGNMSLDNECG